MPEEKRDPCALADPKSYRLYNAQADVLIKMKEAWGPEWDEAMVLRTLLSEAMKDMLPPQLRSRMKR